MDQMVEADAQALITRPPTAIQITSEDDEARESGNLIVLRKMRKSAEEQFAELKRPFNEGLTALKRKFDGMITPLKAAEDATSAAILRWRRELEERARLAREAAQKEARRLQAERDAQQRLLEQQARAQHIPPPPPLPIVSVAPAVAEPARGWQTNQGTLGSRKVPKFRVTNESEIPIEMEIDGVTVRLWNIDEVAIGKVRRAYGEKPSPIPGIEFYYEEGLSVK